MGNMLTVLEALKLSDEFLQKYSVESPRLNAELLLANVMKCRRLDLYLHYDKPLSETEKKQYRDFIKRRSRREPLQYIIGQVEFYGNQLFVNPSVLIPRPETELLVEAILAKYGKDSTIRFLDIGVGSGNISIALLKNLSLSEGLGIDISEDALKTALRNATFNNVGERLELRYFDVLNEQFQQHEKFDLIVSNPPYVSDSDFHKLEPELKVYEPKISLTDNRNGFSFYERIISLSMDLLKPGSRLFFELGKDQYPKVSNLLKESGFKDLELIKDYNNIERIISGVR